MSRNDLALRVGAALVAIVAIGLAAATVRSPIETGGSGGSGGGSGTGTGSGNGPAQPGVGGEGVPQFFEYLVYALLVIVAIALAWYLLFHRRELLRLAAVVVAACIVLVVLVWLFTEFGPEPSFELSNETVDEPAAEGGGDPGEGEGDTTPISLAPLLGVLGVITAIFVGALVLTSRRSDEDELAAEAKSALEGEDDAEQAAVGKAAGRAATRIEATDEDGIDNEVYRAWEEMTGLLEVDRPETSTPREFADAAIDAGLARHHVEDLTRLFEDVRYGGTETTDEMEDRAVSVLRQIETEYAVDGAPDEHPNGGAGATATEFGGDQR
ncbi:DUF4129 domain-containing protein [Halostagnicola sp. A-GB9-2]|uniref:DUF4129 domain-containing protein n=1 Tax=Halostagnicola sp. A-GB9-2 TaxID=3048066 RepID=UPI0024C06B3E|nr:DUF4129 domain-containing protein [Halostagnicola sp. A-GB9-2]MDJ1431799.1 DUF4129 domain-containing protein [Halostagnicola sp. A-GB9-2]